MYTPSQPLRAAFWLSGVWLCSPFPHSIMDGKEVAGLLAVLTLMYVWVYIATWWCTSDCPTFYLWCSSRACLSKASQHDFHCKKWTPPKPPNPKAMKFWSKTSHQHFLIIQRIRCDFHCKWTNQAATVLIAGISIFRRDKTAVQLSVLAGLLCTSCTWAIGHGQSVPGLGWMGIGLIILADLFKGKYEARQFFLVFQNWFHI